MVAGLSGERAGVTAARRRGLEAIGKLRGQRGRHRPRLLLVVVEKQIFAHLVVILSQLAQLPLLVIRERLDRLAGADRLDRHRARLLGFATERAAVVVAVRAEHAERARPPHKLLFHLLLLDGDTAVTDALGAAQDLV